MKPIAKINCQINGIYYTKGDEINIKNKEELIKLNELGLVEPLTAKEIQDFAKKTIIKKED